MANGLLTNKGKMRSLELAFPNEFNGAARNTNTFYIALVTSATAPTEDINTFSELTEIVPDTGGGYVTGGAVLQSNSTDWDTIYEDDATDFGYVRAKDVAWTAVTSSLPASGSGARYAVLLGYHLTVGSREVLGWWDLDSDRSVSVGQTLTLQDLEIRLTD